MKKLSFVLAAGLLSLAACTPSTPAENSADANEAALDNVGEVLEDAAENTSNEAAADVLENAADNAHDAADNAQ